MSNTETKNEIGPELKVSDLRERTVVVLQRAGHSVACTMWVEEITKEAVFFYAGDIRTTLILFVQPDGTLRDDTGLQVQVFEYLGEI